MKHGFKLKAIAAAVIASSTVITSTFAEEEIKTKKKKDSIEVIEVTGFRGSLQKSMNAKRFSDGILDSIHAEDVGKSTDQNIADALSRVTGVTVQESDGEGTRISVRGAGASLNQISMNGVTLTSGLSGDANDPTADQGVDLSTFSSDILASIDVQKTASADHNEGSLGANVILRTIKPLNLNKPRRSFEYQYRYNDYSGLDDRKISGSFSDKFLDDTLGVIFTFADETQNARQDRYSASYEDELLTLGDGRARDLATGKVIRTLDESLFDDPNFDPQSAIDTDTEVWHRGTLEAIDLAGANYALNMNNRETQTATLGLQLLASDDTEVQLDVSYSKRETKLDRHTYNMQFAPDGGNSAALVTDPQQDWVTIDRENHTVNKKLVRKGKGRLYRNIGGDTNTNHVATFTIDSMLTDDLSMKLVAGYSRTLTESDPNNLGLGLNPTNLQTTAPLTADFDDQVVLSPSGYDCSTGICELVVAEGFVHVAPGGDLYSNGVAPNISNPLDTILFGPNNITRVDNKNTDTNKSLFIDFDYDVDFNGVVSVEFGGKLSNRIKDVNTLRTNITQFDQIVDEVTGEVVDLGGLADYRMIDLLDGSAFPVDNFMEGVVLNREQEFLKGWGMVNPYKALDIAKGVDTQIKLNPFGSRTIEQDASALYAKLNFEYLDGRLTGNVGLRYVKTDIKANAWSTVQFNRAANVFDPGYIFKVLGAGNTALPPCPTPLYRDIGNDGEAGNDYDNPPINIPLDNQTCSQPELLFEYADNANNVYLEDNEGNTTINPAVVNINNDNMPLLIEYDDQGNFVRLVKNDPFVRPGGNNQQRHQGNPEIKAYVDRSTVDKAIYDQFGNFINPNFPGESLIITDDNFNSGSRRGVNSYGTSSNDIFLPSLNLNYVLNNEMIMRFSASKTMARPKFDSVRPGGSINEAIFDPAASGRVNSVDLKPLESKNLDLSFEWYFNETGMASIAFFRKDMSNFEETLQETWLFKDIRTAYTSEQLAAEGFENIEDLLIKPIGIDADNDGVIDLDPNTGRQVFAQQPYEALTADGVPVADVAGYTGATQTCMPERMSTSNFNQSVIIDCKVAQLDVVRNGKGAVTQGVEFSYTQNYDFLPGVLSGLGFSMNYTYQKSESDEELLASTGQVVKPLPQPFTPKHSANFTLFWEKDGLMLRLANRYNSTQLVDRGLYQAASWLEQNRRLDFSSSYRINKNLSLTFQALNLTDDTRRIFYTSSSRTFNGVELDESSQVVEGGAYEGRTLDEYRTGRLFRLGLRASF